MAKAARREEDKAAKEAEKEAQRVAKAARREEDKAAKEAAKVAKVAEKAAEKAARDLESSAPEELSEYEKQRAEQIAKNNAYLVANAMGKVCAPIAHVVHRLSRNVSHRHEPSLTRSQRCPSELCCTSPRPSTLTRKPRPAVIGSARR